MHTHMHITASFLVEDAPESGRSPRKSCLRLFGNRQSLVWTLATLLPKTQRAGLTADFWLLVWEWVAG